MCLHWKYPKICRWHSDVKYIIPLLYLVQSSSNCLDWAGSLVLVFVWKRTLSEWTSCKCWAYLGINSNSFTNYLATFQNLKIPSLSLIFCNNVQSSKVLFEKILLTLNLEGTVNNQYHFTPLGWNLIACLNLYPGKGGRQNKGPMVHFYSKET